MAVKKAPSGLGKRGSSFWRRVTAKYDLRLDELRILEDACREIELIERIDAKLKTEPVLVAGSMGQDVVHPLVAEVRAHRQTLKALLGALKLPDEASVDEPVGEVNQHRQAAQSQWARAYGAGG